MSRNIPSYPTVVTFTAYVYDGGFIPPRTKVWHPVYRELSGYGVFRAAAHHRHPGHLWNPSEPVPVRGSVPRTRWGSPAIVPGSVTGRPVVVVLLGGATLYLAPDVRDLAARLAAYGV